jgi:dihydrofolate synthase/folylpolyglutamate synthase
LDANLTELSRETGGKPVVVVGVLGAHRAAPLLETIGRYAKEIYLVALTDPRATTVEGLVTIIPTSYQGRVVRTSLAEIFPGGGRCDIGTPNDTVVVTGSIYLLGEVMERLEIPA